ncbi:uncharacterized protein LOC130747313, partial [Lotus japonicus]|uniref:uncharacterized protein LOC130747313 n=1 Tax=Lotus japonicus TaxID=34305 RepID=UPI002587D3B2
MLKKYCFEALDVTLRDLMRSKNEDNAHKPFGGKVIILGGDFRQILHVIIRGSRQEIVESTINSSLLSKHCKVMNSDSALRTDEDSEIQGEWFTTEFLNDTKISGMPNHKLFGTNVNDKVHILRMDLVPSDSKFPIKFRRRQFPIVICFAMTINKSQGQALSQVGLFLPRPVFTHGQLYVAL